MTTKPLIPVADAASIVNSLTKQYIGTEGILADDLSNISDFGRSFENLDSGTKEIVKSNLITLVTEQLVIAKEYKGNEVDIIHTRSETYDPSAGIVQKVRLNLREAVSDKDAYGPDPNTTSDPFKNIEIDAEAKYFYKPFQFRYEWSVPERWMTGMFMTRNKFNEFISAIDVSVKNSLALNIDNITRAVLRSSIALNLNGASPRAVNLLKTYNNTFKTSLKAAQALQTPEFLRWSLNQIAVVMKQLSTFSTLYNEMGYANYMSDPKVVVLDMFENAAKQYLQADVFNKDLLELPGHNTIVSWKGLLSAKGGVPSFESLSTVKETFSVDWEKNPVTVDQSGVIAHIFDYQRCAIRGLGMKTTSMADPVGLKTNCWTHVCGSSITDPYENSVTFYIKDEA